MRRLRRRKRYDNKNLIFVICGPSGVGKSTLKRLILEKHSDIRLCPSVTTRPKRQPLIGIEEYHYISEEEYFRLYNDGQLIARKVRQFGFFYGIKLKDITDILEKGQHVLLETTLWGISQLRNHFNNVISIFVAPPSIEELKRRLGNRKREGDAEVDLRLALAEDILSDFRKDLVSYYLINDDLSVSIQIIDSIIDEARSRLDTSREIT